MRKRALSIILSAVLVGAQVPVFAQSARVSVDLAAGMRQVEEGDFDSAIVTLNRVVKSLASERTSKDLAKAHLYIAIANLGLSQEAAAKARLLDALSADKSLSLSPDEYPPNIIQLFNQVRHEAGIATTAPPPPSREAPPADKKGGSKLPWILGGGLVAGGVGLVALKGGGNKAPSVGSIQVNPQIALASATNVEFRAMNASDPDGDSLNFNWNFGDGLEVTGESANHVYEKEGSFTITLTVSDGKKDAKATATVQVRTLTGRWGGNTQGFSGTFFTWNLRQDGQRITGTYSDPNNGTGTAQGEVSIPNRVVLHNAITGYRVGNWNGAVDPTLNRIDGDVDWFQGGTTKFFLTRQ